MLFLTNEQADSVF
jgi:hypothetical protein